MNTPQLNKVLFDFYSSHHQFYLYDKDSPGETDSSNFWTEKAHRERLALESGIIGVGTESYGPVKGELVILSEKNEAFLLEDFDHIVETGIEIKSGSIQIVDCPNFDVQHTINVQPGEYGCRVYSLNLDSVVDGEEGNDYYLIELWSEKNVDKKVLKQYVL